MNKILYDRIPILISICIISVMINIDVTALNLGLAQLIKVFNININKGQFMLSLYFFGASSFFIIAGKLTDIFGEKIILYYGILIFFITSIIITFSSSFYFICILRTIQGVGYAFIFPSIVLIANQILPEGSKISGVSLIIAISAFAQGIGPSIAGILLDYFTWKSIFYFDAIISFISLCCLSSYRHSNSRRTTLNKFDFKGCTIFYSLFLIIFTILENLNYIILLPIILISTLIIYIPNKSNYRKTDAFINISLLKNIKFLLSCTLRFLFNICWAIILVYPSLYLQNVLDLSPVFTGIITITFTLTSAIISLASNYFHGNRKIYIGLSILLIVHLITNLFNLNLSIAYFVLLLLTYGTASGILLPTITKMTIYSLTDNEKGQGLGFFYTFSLLSIGLGTRFFSYYLDNISRVQARLYFYDDYQEYVEIISANKSLRNLKSQLPDEQFSFIEKITYINHNEFWLNMSFICLFIIITLFFIYYLYERNNKIAIS